MQKFDRRGHCANFDIEAEQQNPRRDKIEWRLRKNLRSSAGVCSYEQNFSFLLAFSWKYDNLQETQMYRF